MDNQENKLQSQRKRENDKFLDNRDNAEKKAAQILENQREKLNAEQAERERIAEEKQLKLD